MILAKLQDALAEVDRQREALAEVEAQLRSMISKLSGMPSAPASTQVWNSPAPTPERDRIDDLVDIFRVEGRPLHISVMAEKLSAQLGIKVDRRQIEPGLNRHVSNAKRRRIDKFGPSTFGLPEWKTNPPQQERLDDVA